MDLFEKFSKDMGPLGQHSDMDHTNYYMFPKLEGPIAPRMKFRGKEVLTWSLNNYLGLANHPEVREADTKATEDWGLAYPMGARMMTGNTVHHEKFENDLAEFVQKESCMLLNYGYQGIMSAIDAIVGRKDIVVYDAECHACIIDGLRLHVGKRFVYLHNDMESLEKQLVRAEKLAKENGGGVLVITEGVFGMSGSMGNIKGVVELKKKYEFRLLIDDAHGFGTMGPTGAGTGEEQGVQDGVDLYFSTFAKSMASIGAFIAGDKKVIDFLKYNVRSQIFAKSLPMPLVIGNQKRLDLLKSKPELKDKLWTIVNAMQKGLKDKGFNIGNTQSPVTPVFLNGAWQEAANMIKDLRNNYNIFCSMIVYPVVPKGVIMLRIIPTAAHSMDDVNETISVFEQIKSKLDKGVYQTDEVGELA
ncbi:aminotransferase class I/II-fold pyridoxal phosphate-dependent enzyme [Reichenbachiella ulvae]|uniref:Aminotransferase class I/II-fold pyridoxal phosphate-dependent enzyme n=1 Tax=Reichenbachiella ulvae TaxID=2980104 RepID=A0ABT3CQ91_9BACT|nr:aminotransferase class I/II-fold pyridoxal phosphate-dependent enzyme [Reichenbachiella ulvae]MCV9385684.1 aminotransferase class I/II-fold pyridoxal phosphate-dependent enzyme [Reichenbachiella ulvae]